MRKLPCALLLLMLLVPAARSEAAPILFNFTVDFDDGALAGRSFQGSFSVDGSDCPGGICDELFSPDDLAHTLLSFDVTIDGAPFDITADSLYPSGPFVQFSAGNILLIYFSDSQLLPLLSILSSNVFFFDAVGTFSGGSVTNIQAVPEPATMTLLGLGLAALGVRRWRQRKVS